VRYYCAAAVHAAMSASGSVTLTTNELTVTDRRQTFARAGGSIVNFTKPFRDPLTSQRLRLP
jgi:hypothetical protein